MPTVNGKNYRTFGQGYAQEKSAQSAEPQEQPQDADEGHEGQGSEMHVKHHGGGRFSTKSKHHDGHTTQEQHDSEPDLHEHMAKHFGTQSESQPEESGDDYEGGNALKSILSE